MILYSAANVRGVFVGNRNQSEQMMRAVERAGSRPVIAHVSGGSVPTPSSLKSLPLDLSSCARSSHTGPPRYYRPGRTHRTHRTRCSDSRAIPVPFGSSLTPQTFDFKDLPKAYEALERAGHIGKIVVRVNP
jgi:hypothetical protein